MRYALILSVLVALPAHAADDLPQGLQSARLLPGWTDTDGNRIAALELVLEPGWKTYWRSPGDTGLPPEFDWQGSNIGDVAFHWPAPEEIESAGLRTLGYHDRLVLPFTVTPAESNAPVGLSAEVTFGLCENICIPAKLTLAAPSAGNAPDPVIETAIARAPTPGTPLPACTIGEIEDGMVVTLSLPDPDALVAVEYTGDPDIWISAPQISADGTEAAADLVAPSGKPFPLDPTQIVLTSITDDGATEYQGCAAG
ncbi:protein-disulfide reductase DsbD domain-containing protein [Paracoccus sp. SCSIO 75233]|uniref:protein-disulfide reductase DsbD domain-containing protein n=1 Tax=Paracoccus sp. SCSIO 75233 TaxID=3017782 RepID=UPI0022F0DF75|nr:protein-disulfide reductase DsbD domain-containing protein [Paracoccus sp. SCSIO 75233]WBU53167.1 protein-disulfide reductase DsbD family protein [Paracoccus sp. SCSIO 75233]